MLGKITYKTRWLQPTMNGWLGTLIPQTAVSNWTWNTDPNKPYKQMQIQINLHGTNQTGIQLSDLSPLDTCNNNN